MRMTPLEIQNHQFSRRLSGLDPEEVASFLKIIADDYESALRENERLKDTVHQLEQRNQELASGEKVLRETLVSAQDMAAKLRETAVAESEVLLSTAELRAEKIIDASHRRAATLAEEIRELRGLRGRYAASMRSMIDTHLGLIDRLERDDEEPVPQLTGIMRKYRNSDFDDATPSNAEVEPQLEAEALEPDEVQSDEALATVVAEPETADAEHRAQPRTERMPRPAPFASPPPA